MKLRNLFITLGLSLTVASAGIIIGSGLNAKEPVKAEAHSTSGLTLVHQGNSESLVGRNAYVIGQNTSYGIRDDGKFGKDGTLLEFVIAEGTTGSKIRLARADNGKYLNNPISGSYSDSPVDRYINSYYYLCTDSDEETYYCACKYSPDTTVYYEANQPDLISTRSLVSKFQVYAAPAKLNLKVNDGWADGGARFAAYFFGKGDSTTWVDMSLVSGSTKLYTVAVPDGYPSVIFCRLYGDNPTNDWGNVMHQTGDLSVTDGNYYLMYDDSMTGGIWHNGKNNVYLEGNFSNPQWTALDDYKFQWNKLSGQYELKAFSGLSATNVFKAYNASVASNLAWAGYVSTGMTNNYDLFSEGSDNNIVCNTDTVYDIYYKPQHYKLWIEENAVVAATNFSTTFLSTTNGICVDSSKTSGDTNVSALAAVWNAKATPDGTSLVEKWNALSDGAKGTFVEGDANVTIEDAHDRYVHIMGRYSGTLTPFTDGPQYSAINVHSILGEQSNSGSNITIIIVIASASILAVAGVFFLRRKHEN